MEDHGVKSPEQEASKVIAKGGTIDLPVSEEIYEEGKDTKIKAEVTKKFEVFGVSSVVALVILVGRMVKHAHHTAKKAIFRKTIAKSSDDEKKK